MQVTDLFAERYGWTHNDTLALPHRERDWLIETVSDRNEAEADAAKG